MITNKIQHNKKALLDALSKSLGVVQTACKLVGIDRSTFYKYVKEDDEFKEAVENIEQEAIDFVESKLFERVEGVWIDSGKVDNNDEPIVYKSPPSDTAIIFYLKTKGKKRGYVERQEIDLGTRENQVFKIAGQEIKF
jgi:hypothetical protein